MYFGYKKKLETLLSADIWNKKFVKKCYKKRKLIIQPILLDITENCNNDNSILSKPGKDSLLSSSFDKEKLYEVATRLLVKQHLSLIASYNKLSSDSNSKRCLLLSQCYIKSIPVKKIIM